jgi:hypothetical protein
MKKKFKKMNESKIGGNVKIIFERKPGKDILGARRENYYGRKPREKYSGASFCKKNYVRRLFGGL